MLGNITKFNTTQTNWWEFQRYFAYQISKIKMRMCVDCMIKFVKGMRTLIYQNRPTQCQNCIANLQFLKYNIILSCAVVVGMRAKWVEWKNGIRDKILRTKRNGEEKNIENYYISVYHVSYACNNKALVFK